MKRVMYWFCLAFIVSFTNCAFGHENEEVRGLIWKIGDYHPYLGTIVIGADIPYELSARITNATETEIVSVAGNLFSPDTVAGRPISYTFTQPIPLYPYEHPFVGAPPLPFAFAEFSFTAPHQGFSNLSIAWTAANASNGEVHPVRTEWPGIINLEVRKGGDMDGDVDVDFADFLSFSAAFDNGATNVGFEGGDFDLNGKVEFADFLILSREF